MFILKFVPFSVEIVSAAVTGFAISLPDIDAVFVIVESVDKGAKLFIFASYMIVVLPPGGNRYICKKQVQEWLWQQEPPVIHRLYSI